MTSNLMSAKMLETSASAISAYSVIRLFESAPGLKDSFGEQAFDYWKDFIGKLVGELSVALSESQPELFLAKIRWEKAAFQAREFDEKFLSLSLDYLKSVVGEELPDGMIGPASEIIDLAKNELSEDQSSEAKLIGDDQISQLAGNYLVKILEGDTHSAIQTVVTAHQNGLSLEDTYLSLVRAQTEVGRMWHVAEISVAEEHLVTHTTHRAMSVLNYQTPRSPSNGKTLISSAVAGNYHDLGIRAITDFFEFAGWRVICLGNDTPELEIADSAKSFGASLVMLSANMSAHLNAARKSIELVKASSPDCKIILGGEIFRELPDLAASLGGDGFATGISEAVSLGNQLCGVG